VTIAVFDIDGVVADVRHRLRHLDAQKSWRRFFGAAAADGLLAEGADLVAEQANDHDIVWLTGRPEWLRAVTTQWLATHDLPAGELFLRPDGDYRPAALYKLGILHQLAPRDIALFVDDDSEVIAAADSAGIPTRLAAWVPRDGQMREAQDRLGRT
jgi:hypothetical protein